MEFRRNRVLQVAIAAVVGLAAVLGISRCGGAVNNGAPPRAHDVIKSEIQSSVIAVPIAADLSSLSAALEREVPRQLWTIDQPGQVCVPSKKVKVLFVKIKTPTLHCRLVGQVVRGPLAISGSGRDIVITMPINAVIHARDIGGILKQETATAAAQVRAIIHLDLASDWSLRGKVDIAYDWTKEPAVDFMGKHIELTSKADAKLAGVVAKLEQTLPGELAKLQFREKVQTSWNSAFTSLRLNRDNPPVWMRVTPQDLQYGGYTVEGRSLVLKLGMRALTETFVGDRPADPPRKSLPSVRPLEASTGELQFYIPVIADYAELEPVIAKALVKRSARPFPVPGLGDIYAQFSKVTAYGTTGGRIAVGLEFSALDASRKQTKSHGTIWLTGLPLNPANTRQINFTDVTVNGATDSTGTNLLLKLANTPAFADTIADALKQNFTKDYDSLLGKIERAIDEKRESNLVIRVDIQNVRTGSLKAAGNGLYLPVWGTGRASIQVLR